MNEIKIVDILRCMPGSDTRLYSSLYGWCVCKIISGENIRIFSVVDNCHTLLTKYGKLTEEGDVVLFPSKEMRDWNKFFKKGDVVDLNYAEGDTATCVFVDWVDDNRTVFKGKFFHDSGDKWNTDTLNFETAVAYKSNAPKSYIEALEKHYDGKLNLDTLEIEFRLPKPKLDIDKLYSFVLENEYEYVARYKGEDKDGYPIWGEHICLNPRDASKCEYSEVWENVCRLEYKHFYNLTEASKENESRFHFLKQAYVEKKDVECNFTAFQQVLVRDDDDEKWSIGFFSYYDRNSDYPYCCLLRNYRQCISFAGHEDMLGADI